ncbi:MAG: FAD-binding protein [Dethiosulfatibacter sp.]|nr:FAD-binding protein [Dethiosulfatibacter sp.]
MKKIIMDVVIIGGGLSGLMASLESKKDNLEVAIVSKSIAGKSGNTIVSGAAMASVNEINYDSEIIFKKDVNDSAKGINNDEMTDFFCKESKKVVDVLTSYGVKFKKKDTQYVTKQPPGHSVSRSFPVDISEVAYHNRGLSILNPILENVKSNKISIFNNTVALKIIKKANRVLGVICLDKEKEELIVFVSKVVIIAAGGGGNVYSNTNNTRDITGDSYTLALESGCELVDMEYVQFYPTMMFKPLKVTVSNPLFGEGAVLKNIHNREFMYDYSNKGNIATRDSMAHAIYNEIKEGRGNPNYIYVDSTNIPEDIIEKKYKEFELLLNNRELSLMKDLLPVAPASHFYLGGIKINKKCETGIEGLLACGEAACGVHGANRLSGNALTETVIFGIEAGKTAVYLIKNMKVESDDFDFIEKNSTEYEKRIRFNKGEYSISELKNYLRNTMWEHASVIRNKKSLIEGIEKIDKIKRKLSKVDINDTHDYYKLYELKNLLRISEMILNGALLRKESRGSHYRKDFPSKNDEFRGNFVYKLKAEEIEISFIKKESL